MKFSILYTLLMVISLLCRNTNKSDINNIDTNKNSKMTTSDFDPFVLHYDAVVVDTHNDIMMQVMEKGVDMTIKNSNTQSDLVRMKNGGLDVQVFSIYVPEKYKRDYFGYVMSEIDMIESIARNNPDKLVLVKNYPQLESELNKGKVIGILGGEGGAMVEGSIENLETLYSRGLRYLGLTWNTSNEIAISARDENDRRIPGGLKDFGFRAVKKMDELGMMIDVSHLGETAFWDVIKTSKNPIIASHSSAYSLLPHYRNLNDEQIKAIAKSGGVVFVNFYTKFLDNSSSKISSYNKRYANELRNIEAQSNGDLIKYNKDRYEFIMNNIITNGTSVDVLIDHIDYIAKLVGADHVGIGSDFDGEITVPNELYDATCYPIITKKLHERGYTENDIRKILGNNFLRVFKQVCK